VNSLVVRGGTVLTPHGWVVADVSAVNGRFVSGLTDVHIGGETVDGPEGRPDGHTGGAGAERVAHAQPVEGEAAAAAREATLAAAGSAQRSSPRPPDRPAAPGPTAGPESDHQSGAAYSSGPTRPAGPAAADVAGGPGPGSSRTVLDARGLRVVPGFVDLQCNGGWGIDLAAEPERLWELAALLPRTGVTAWLPTIVTGPPAARARALAALRAGPPPSLRAVPLATPLGVHYEGPFLAPDRRGAHPPSWLRRPGDPELVDEVAGWSADAGVRLVTLAPELPGALDLVRALVSRGVVVSAGHSSATAAEAEAGVDGGIRYVTHLFNAMSPLHHREPGLVGVALTDDRLTVGVIADGLHVDIRAVRLATRALGDRLSLVTDAVAALGLVPGDARLGDQAVVAGADGVRMADGTLAGSTLALDQAVGNAQAMAGLDLEAAVRAVTSVPSGLLGLLDRGVVAPGAVADLVLLDDDGRVVATVIGGRVAYARGAVPAEAGAGIV
jgi:N-acetylglucosamine-6-phosphate deacetylase